MTSVNDDVFSKKMVGDGFAVVPSDGKILAPTDGKIVTVMSTKHAITMTSAKGGLEILLHFGLDTVDLKGAPFDIKVKEGQTVKKGTVLAQMVNWLTCTSLVEVSLMANKASRTISTYIAIFLRALSKIFPPLQAAVNFRHIVAQPPTLYNPTP